MSLSDCCMVFVMALLIFLFQHVSSIRHVNDKFSSGDWRNDLMLKDHWMANNRSIGLADPNVVQEHIREH